VGTEARSYTSQHGLPIQADIGAAQVSADDFDAIIIPGGAAPDAMRRDPAMAALIHDMEQRGKVVVAISSPDPVLTSVHDEDDAHTKRFFSLKARVQQAEGVFAESTVLREGNVITACPPVNLTAFCRMIIVALMAAHSTPSEHLKNYG
jgi:protease I